MRSQVYRGINFTQSHARTQNTFTLFDILFSGSRSFSEFERLCLFLISHFRILMFLSFFILIQGSLHESLVETVRAHTIMHTGPYCRLLEEFLLTNAPSRHYLSLFHISFLLILSNLFSKHSIAKTKNHISLLLLLVYVVM